jgi:hypothetical protein
VGIGTTSFSEGTQPTGTISIIPNSSVSSGPLIQFAGNGRIRPASIGDRLSIDGAALYLNSTFSGNIIMATGGGNVGIGTNIPSEILEVKHPSNNGGAKKYVFKGYDSTGNINGIALRVFDTAGGVSFADVGADYYGTGSDTNLTFSTRSGGSALTERMRITSGGNVGIGTTSPNGNLQFSNNTNNRKIVLYQGANNDFEFYGFGVDSATLVYTTYTTGDDHVFFAGTGPTSRKELMRVRGNGIVTIPSQPAFSVYQSGQGGPSGVMTYNTTILNRGNCVNLSNGRFTAPVAGAYQISFMAFQQSGTSGILTCVLYKNGVAIPVRTYQNDPASEYGPHATISAVLSLAANDFIYVNIDSGQIHGNDDGYFSGFLIG